MTRYGLLILLTLFSILAGLASSLWKAEGKIVVNEILPSPRVVLVNPFESILKEYQQQMEKLLIIRRIMKEVENVKYNVKWSAFLTTDEKAFDKMLYELKKETGESPKIREKVYLDGTTIKYCRIKGILFVLKKVKTE